jgi:arsenite methyltransferase
MPDYLAFQPDFNDPQEADSFDELPLWSAMFGLLLFKHLALRPDQVVLDIGYGTGFPLLELALRLGPTCRVYGVDPWGAARRRARLKAGLWQVGNAWPLPGDAAALPFRAGLFDLVVSNLGLNNFSDPATALQECGRVSKPGARLVLTTNLQGTMQEFYAVFETSLVELGQLQAVQALHKHVAHRATLQGLADLFQRAGFRLADIHEETGVLRYADGSAFLNHFFIKRGFMPAWKTIPDPAGLEAVFARLEANLNHLAQARGELALTIPMAYVEAEKVD